MACCYSSVSTGIQMLQVIERGLLFTRQKGDFRQSYLHQKRVSACFDFWTVLFTFFHGFFLVLYTVIIFFFCEFLTEIMIDNC